jgi:succinoglycan biosynthesis transport protein ExoP
LSWGKSIRTEGADPFLELTALARRRIRLIAGTVGFTLCVVLTYLILVTPSYQSMVEILVDPQALQIVGRGLTRTDTSASLDLAGVDSQPLIFNSTRLLEEVIAKLHLDADPVLASGSTSEATRLVTVLGALRQRMVVRRVDASLVFQITVSHPVASQAARIANAIASTYFKLDAQDRKTAVVRASTTLLDQSAKLRDDLLNTEAAVERFKAQQGLISTGQAGLLVSQQLRDLYTQISVYEANVARLAARQRELGKLNAAQVAGEPSLQSGGGTPEAIESPVISALRAQYAAIAQNEAQLQRTLGDRHPDLANAREQRQAVLAQIQSELARIARSSDEELRRAKDSLSSLRKRADGLVQSQVASNEAEIKLRQLESEASAIRLVYDASIGRVKELQQQQQLDTNNSRVISEALESARPYGVPKTLVLLAGLLFGAFLGLSLAYLRELLSGVLANVAAVQAVAPIPVVAELSKTRRGEERSIDDKSRLRKLGRTLRMGFGGKQPAVIVITGQNRQDIACIADDVAGVLAQSGAGVLRCSGGFGERAVTSMRIGSPNFVVKNGLLVNAAERFIVADIVEPTGFEAIECADTVLVVVEPGFVTLKELNAACGIMERIQEKAGEGRLGLLCLRSSQFRLSWPNFPRLPSPRSLPAWASAS